MLVLIDELRNILRGTIAAPVIADLFDNILHIRIEANIQKKNLKYQVGTFVVPDFIGKKKNEGSFLKIYDFEYSLGDGDIVTEQFLFRG